MFWTVCKDDMQRTADNVKIYNIGLHQTLKNGECSITLPLKKNLKYLSVA